MKKIIFIYEKIDGSPRKIRADIIVSTSAELPATTGFTDFELTAGTVAYVIQTGEFYVLDANGKWYNSDGTGEAG